MKARRRQLRLTIVATLVLFVGSILSITGYTLWRLRSDTLVNGLEVAATQARGFEELLTQSLHVTELLAANTLEQTLDVTSTRDLSATFVTILSRTPYLRSMSLLDADGRIVASSNRANIGLQVTIDSYLPRPGAQPDLLRIGAPWSGRDFADGRATSAAQPADPMAPAFIPVTQTISVGTHTVTLLLALNPDYFINYMTQRLTADEGSVEVLRYDGTLMLATDPAAMPGTLPAHVFRQLHGGDAEAGLFEQKVDDGRDLLIAYRASRLYPIVVVAQVRRPYALRHWQSEAAILLAVVCAALLAVTVLSRAFYRRQLQFVRQRAEAEHLQRINATVFDSSNEAILITDLDTVVMSINAAFTRVTGYAPADVIGRPLFDLLTREGIAAFGTAVLGPPRLSAAQAAVNAGHAPALEAALVCKNGEQIWTEILSTPEHDAQGRVLGYHRICRNITERKEMQDQVRQLAFYDPLTQLANRRLLNDRLAHEMNAGKRSGRFGALLFLDLDNFKPLNDAHGHEVGDLLLREVANRLRACVREIDTVSRFGGDEFVVMLSALGVDRDDSAAQAKGVAEKIRASLAEPYQLRATRADQREVIEVIVEHRCSVSIGVALFLDQQATQDGILKAADRAMYQAKDAGRNRICFHTPPAS